MKPTMKKALIEDIEEILGYLNEMQVSRDRDHTLQDVKRVEKELSDPKRFIRLSDEDELMKSIRAVKTFFSELPLSRPNNYALYAVERIIVVLEATFASQFDSVMTDYPEDKERVKLK